MLDVIYSPNAGNPERQHDLNRIPASELVDQPELNAALVAYEAARADELAKRRAAEAAEKALPESEHADALALADAQAAGEKDPGAKNRTKALSAIAEARRKHAASKITLERAVDSANDVFDEHAATWLADLEAERDQLRSTASGLLDGWEKVWRLIQKNAAARAIATGTGRVSTPGYYAARFRAPQVHDGNVVIVEDALQGMRDLAKPESPRSDIVANVEPGADPSRQKHTPPTRQPFAGARGSQQMLGGRVPDEQVKAWAERESAELKLSAEQRAERMARADERIAQREADAEAAGLAK